jgi:hypothetical protein
MSRPDSSRTFSADEYSGIARKLLAPGNSYMPIFKELFQIMPESSVLLLSHLMDREEFIGRLRENKGKRFHGWFWASETFISEAFPFMSKRSQYYVISDLKKREFLRTRLKGSPPKRFVQINVLKIMEALQISKEERLRKKWEEFKNG